MALAPGLWIFVREWHQIVVFDNGVPFAIGILLSVFLTWHPGRALLRQDSRPAPWWWDIAVYATFAMMIFAFYIDHAYPYIVAAVSVFLLNLYLAVAIAFVEYRHQTRVYLRPRAYVFIPLALNAEKSVRSTEV